MTDQEPQDHSFGEKPFVLAGEPYPYTRLPNPKRFEELLYGIFNILIKNSMLPKHDGISLMPGVADDGKDCTLYLNGYCNGIIQCKKYDSHLTKDDFGKEVTKFVLYSLVDSNLISDPCDFTYYIAVSKNFVKDCSDFIDNFNRAIQHEKEVPKWISYNLKKYAKLTSLKVREAELRNDVVSVLQQIVIKKIQHQDLDNYLSMSLMQPLVGQFFELKSMTDTIEITKLRKELKFYNSKELSKSSIDHELNRSSISLRSEKNEFLGINDSHIDRIETESLFEWLKNPLKKDDRDRALNFCLLAGNAGMGKTVILKDLYDKLSIAGIPVLGLKADKIISASIKELQEKIALSVPIYDFIENCKRVYPTTVLVIDQIDALSQSMSSDKSYLQVFKDLIDQYTHDPNVRVIVSVRLADLQFDPSLKVYKSVQTIKVGPLPDEAVFTQLKKIGIAQQDVPEKLLHLLRTPNHFNIFSQIINRKKHLGLTSIQQIYQLYWKEKIINVPARASSSKGAVKQLVYKIAQRMFSLNAITLSMFQFEDNTDELSYLASERIIKIEDNSFQFFHQSFYDFAFSKQFVETGDDLYKYIIAQDQSLHIRSAVRMIVNYYRDYDPMQYQRLVEQIFKDPNILFHLKHLLFTALLQHESPTNGEKDLVADQIKHSFQMLSMFFETATSNIWFDFSIEQGVLDVLNQNEAEFVGALLSKAEFKHVKNDAFFFLRSFTFNNYSKAWDVAKNLIDVKMIVNILFSQTDWTNPISFELFEKCNDQAESDSFAYYHILASIAAHKPDYALEKIEQSLPNRNRKRDATYRDYEEHEVLKALAKDFPETLIDVLFKTISADFRKEQFDGYNDYFIPTFDYTYTVLHDDDTLTGKEFLYRLLAVCLKKTAAKGHPKFDRFFAEQKNSRYKAVLRLIIFALEDNEQTHWRKVHDLFLFFGAINHFEAHSKLLGTYRDLFERAFPYFPSVEQRSVLETISAINIPSEVRFWKSESGQINFSKRFGVSKYAWMRRLPEHVFDHNPTLKLQFRGWQRKFEKTFQEAYYSGILMANAAGYPISQDRLAFFKQEQWLKLFRKYDNDVRGFEEIRSGLSEHARAFRIFITNNPHPKNINIISASLDDPLIPLIYALEGIDGWLDGKGDPMEIVELARPLLTGNKETTHEFTCMSIAISLARAGITDSWLIDYLIAKSVAFDLPDDKMQDEPADKETSIKNGLWSKGASSNYGRTIRALFNVRQEQVLDLFEHILRVGPGTAKAVVLYEFAYVMRQNPERVFGIFANTLNLETDSHVLASSIHAASYLINHDFRRLIPGFHKLIALKNLGDDDSRNLFVVLLSAYLHGYEQSEELILKLIRENGKSARIAVSEIIRYYYTIDGTIEKCNNLLHQVLEVSTEEDHEEMRWTFIQVEHLKLPDIFSFLKAYVQSRYFKLSEYFLEYLTFQCKNHLELSIELFEIALDKNSFVDEEDERSITNDNATKFIIGAFNSLQSQTSKNTSLNHKLLLSFDKVLMDFRYRGKTEKLLEELL